MTPGFHIVGSLIPAFFKNSMQLELQIICQLWLTLFVESLLINFGEGDIKIVEYRITSDCLLYGIIYILLLFWI
jgi:hypothetical protein